MMKLILNIILYIEILKNLIYKKRVDFNLLFFITIDDLIYYLIIDQKFHQNT